MTFFSKFYQYVVVDGKGRLSAKETFAVAILLHQFYTKSTSLSGTVVIQYKILQLCHQ